MSDETPPSDPPPPKPPRRRRTTPAKAAAPGAKRKVPAVESATVAEVLAAKPTAKRASGTTPRRRAKAADASGTAAAKPKRVRKPKVAAVGADAPAVEPAPQPATLTPEAPAPEAIVPAPVVHEALTAPSAESVGPVAADADAAAIGADIVPPPADDHGLAHGECPADLPGAAQTEAGGVRWAASILAVSSPLLLLFNSHAIDNWARQLPVNSWSAPVIDAATRWHATMQRIGLAAPVDAGRAGWKRVKGEDAG